LTWQALEKAGFSLLKLSPAVFYSITTEELMLMIEGERDRSDVMLRLAYEVARYQVRVLISPHMKKGKSYNQKFPWEKQQRDGVTDEQTRLDIQKTRKAILKRDNKKAVKITVFKG
jgi:hypothetical protein